MDWRQTYADRAERAKRLKPLVKEGSILVLMEDTDFRWATYRIKEINISRSGSQHYYVDNSYNCNTTGRCGDFAVEEPRRGWSDADGSVYEIFLHDAIAVFPDEETAQPLIQQLIAA